MIPKKVKAELEATDNSVTKLKIKLLYMLDHICRVQLAIDNFFDMAEEAKLRKEATIDPFSLPDNA